MLCDLQIYFLSSIMPTGVRDPSVAQSVEAGIKAACPFAKLECLPLDLASFASIQQFVQSFTERDLPLHVLINNGEC